MKKLFSVILSLVMLLSVVCVAPVGANAAVVDLQEAATDSSCFEYSVLDEYSAEIVGYCGADDWVEIPEAIDGYTIVRIGDGAFYGNENIKCVDMQYSSVMEIGFEAFYGCTSLEWVGFSEKLCIIDIRAFANCYSLSYEVTLPESLLEIREGAFEMCHNMKEVYILSPYCYIMYSEYVFYYDTIIYGYSGSTAEMYAQEYGRTFIQLDAPYSYDVTADGTATITDYYGDDPEAYIPDCIDGYTVTAIGEGAFADNEVVSRVVIPATVTDIEDEAFYNATNLCEVEFVNHLVYSSEDINNEHGIGDRAFANTGLHQISIPGWVIEIGEEAFYNCTELQEVDFDYCCDDHENYRVGRILRYAFANTAIEQITIPDRFLDLEEAAFSGCLNLTYVDLPQELSRIGRECFYGCTLLKEIVFPEKVYYIEDMAFGNCAITELKFDGEVDTIMHRAFYDCPMLETVVLSENVSNVCFNAFGGCPQLQTVMILNPECNIEYDAFYYATIICHKNSTAHEYALEHGMEYILIDGDVEDLTQVKPDKVSDVHYWCNSDTSITLEWEAAMNVVNYWVYIDGKVYAKTSDTEIVINNLKPAYDYEVVIIGGFEDKTAMSVNDAEAVTVSTTPDYSFKGEYTADLNSITFDFTAMGAEKTWVYFGTSKDNLKLYASTTTGSCTVSKLTDNTGYYYTVAHLVDGVVMKTNRVYEASTVANIELTAYSDYNDGILNLSWNAYTDAIKYWVTVTDESGSTKTYGVGNTTEYTLSNINSDCVVVIKVAVNVGGKTVVLNYYPLEIDTQN